MNTKPILVLDLDETLVSTIITYNNNNQSQQYNVHYRPYLIPFLKKMNRLFTIHVYTNGSRNYANYVTDSIICSLRFNPFKSIKSIEDNRHFDKSTKSLDNIKDANYTNTIIIDDSIDVWNYDSLSVLTIKPYYYQSINIDDDNELCTLSNLLTCVANNYLETNDLSEYFEYTKKTYKQQLIIKKSRVNAKNKSLCKQVSI